MRFFDFAAVVILILQYQWGQEQLAIKLPGIKRGSVFEEWVRHPPILQPFFDGFILNNQDDEVKLVEVGPVESPDYPWVFSYDEIVVFLVEENKIVCIKNFCQLFCLVFYFLSASAEVCLPLKNELDFRIHAVF